VLSLDDTIAAIATPLAGAARGIVRMSGRNAIDCLRRCFDPAGEWPTELKPHIVTGELTGGLRLPCDAYIWPSRQSYTRQPCVELHTFGSPPLIETAVHTLCAHGARLAQPGEFTLRAFLAGRLDLTQAEAVLGVIDAHDHRQLTVALEQLAGGLARPLNTLRGDLLDLLADVEAGLDFVEEHIEFVAIDEVTQRLGTAQAHLQSVRNAMAARTATSAAPRVVLTGSPNAGKSSLFNALAGSVRSIVSDVAGTTRDYLEAEVDCAGILCTFVDTAGADAQSLQGTLGAAAQSATASQIKQAHLRVLCIDATRPLHAFDRQQLSADEPSLVALTKCDAPRVTLLDQPAIETSALTGQGLDTLRAEIAAWLNRDAVQAVPATAERCRTSIDRALENLSLAQHLATTDAGQELIAAEIRLALDDLAQITGAIYTEDILDRIFSRFCIGK
jgi:tRNA modification GTPase